MLAKLRLPILVLAPAIVIAGCANNELFNGAVDPVSTSSLAQKPKVDPVCQALAAQIESLRGEGIEAKIEKAAARKYRFKKGELTKVDQLTKANADFQSKCSTLPRTASVAPVAGATKAPANGAPTSKAQ
ncbi:MAG: hypothetical protein AB7O43_15690 [Hyphomicrobiaceae bacterium]